MELMDLYDENRIPLGRVADRPGEKKPGEYRTVIHVALFDSKGRMLIQRRTPQKKLWPDRWDLSVGGCVDAGETSRQGAEREAYEDLGYALDLTGVRPSLTVNFDGGFDDVYIVVRDLNLSELHLQEEEVSEVRWATEAEVLAMLAEGSFVGYPKHFLSLLFEIRNIFGFPEK